jgi:hypothetical protein
MSLKEIRKDVDVIIHEIGQMILETPTGPMRNQLCDANIHLQEAIRNIVAVEFDRVLEKPDVAEIN